MTGTNPENNTNTDEMLTKGMAPKQEQEQNKRGERNTEKINENATNVKST